MANKVYNKKGKVHPYPTLLLPSLSTLHADHHLSLFLPAAILALAASLPLHDKEVLAYFLSCSGSGSSVDLVGSRPSTRRRACHAPQFECGCFGCYVSFWSRWDSSNNRHVIDEIIEAFEEQERRGAAAGGQVKARQGRRGRREWKKRGGAEAEGDGGKGGVRRVEAAETAAAEAGEYGSSCGEGVGEEEEVGEAEKGVVRRIGTTIGYKIWNFLDRITM